MLKPSDVKTHEITPKEVYLDRRRFLRDASLAAAAATVGLTFPESLLAAQRFSTRTKLAGIDKSPFSTDESQNSYKQITTYNNFYELGTDKGGPAKNAKYLVTRPWTVSVEGEVKRPKIYDIDDLMKSHPLEERIYRLRCVEAWSMVIPWVGFSPQCADQTGGANLESKVSGLHHVI